jgi:hypothetical protein
LKSGVEAPVSGQLIISYEARLVRPSINTPQLYAKVTGGYILRLGVVRLVGLVGGLTRGWDSSPRVYLRKNLSYKDDDFASEESVEVMNVNVRAILWEVTYMNGKAARALVSTFAPSAPM